MNETTPNSFLSGGAARGCLLLAVYAKLRLRKNMDTAEIEANKGAKEMCS